MAHCYTAIYILRSVECCGISIEEKDTSVVNYYKLESFKFDNTSKDLTLNFVGGESQVININDNLVQNDLSTVNEVLDFAKAALCGICPVVRDDATFDIFQTDGIDTLAGSVGKIYTLSELLGIAIANGAKYEDGTLVGIEDKVLKVEADLKHIGGRALVLGTDVLETSTTSLAAYRNNGSWTALDSGGGRFDSQRMPTYKIPLSSVNELFVENRSAIAIHIIFQKF